MKSWKVRLITAAYSRDDITVELFGKTDTNKSITILYKGFKPYFYLIEPSSGLLSGLKGDDFVLKTEEVDLFHDSKLRKCVKVTIKNPWQVPEYRQKYGTSTTVLAADIPFHHRFIYDFDLASCVKVFGEEVEMKNYTTDIVVQASKFEDTEPFKPQLKILSFDVENSIKTNEIYTICCAVSTGKRIKKQSFASDEKSMLRDFIKYVREEDPDIITGYNIDGYDIPLLIERANHHHINHLYIGRDSKRDSSLRSVSNRFWRLHGRIIADAWWAAKMELRPKQETLAAMSELVLGEKKEDVNPANIDLEWAEDRDKVISYCKKDAELALKILQRIAVIERGMDLATVSRLPLDDVVNGRTSLLIDSLLIRIADRHDPKIGVPMTGGHTKERPIEGGYVHTIDPGLYNWVCVLDFKSMYPSLIIAKNICFTTLDESGPIKSSEPGVAYLDKDTREGLLPGLLERLMVERDEIKSKMIEAKTEEEKAYFDGLQFAIKILMNAVYGVFASAFYRFTNPKIGASITAFARENTKGIIQQLDEEGLKVVYGDTDSVFFQSPGDTLDEALELGQSIADRYSKEGATLEFEKVINPLFSHGAKKRYVGHVMWPEDGRIVRGYETRRTDSFDLQSGALSRVFDMILEHDIEGAVSLARDLVKSTAEGNASVDSLVISRTCRSFDRYKDPDSQSTVQTAKKLIDMGYEFMPGMKVSWIVTNARKSPQEVEPYISGRKFEKTPDYEYYARRIAMTLARITDVFGWDVQELLTGQQRTSLDDFMSSGPSVKKDKVKKETKPKVKKTDKELTLEDFL
jgi:DNA polymerase I